MFADTEMFADTVISPSKEEDKKTPNPYLGYYIMGVFVAICLIIIIYTYIQQKKESANRWK